MVQRVELMLSKFLVHLWFFLLSCRQNVTYLERFTRYKRYTVGAKT